MNTCADRIDGDENTQDLEQVKEQFAHWRANRTTGQRIPQALWTAAASLYPRYSVHVISRELRLDFVNLRDRIPESSRSARSALPQSAASSPFIDLGPATRGPVSEWSDCTISLKGKGARRMKIRVRGAAPGLVAELLRTLGNRIG